MVVLDPRVDVGGANGIAVLVDKDNNVRRCRGNIVDFGDNVALFMKVLVTGAWEYNVRNLEKLDKIQKVKTYGGAARQPAEQEQRRGRDRSSY